MGYEVPCNVSARSGRRAVYEWPKGHGYTPHLRSGVSSSSALPFGPMGRGGLARGGGTSEAAVAGFNVMTYREGMSKGIVAPRLRPRGLVPHGLPVACGVRRGRG
jgi:hypothetical protein